MNNVDKIIAKAKEKKATKQAASVTKIVDEKNRQNSTPPEKMFSPTPAMQKWLAAAMELGLTATISQISEKSKVDRTTWYTWIDKPQFVEWWDNMWKKYIKLHRHKLDLIGFKQSETNHDWWRDMKKVVGEPIPSDPIPGMAPIQVNTQVNVDKYMEEVPDAKN